MMDTVLNLCIISIGFSVAKGCQFTEGFGRATDHCCVDVSGEYDAVQCNTYMYVHTYVHTY